ncbi:MAG: nuclear transport factor 2 family protein [Pseudomonadota bacterium]
MTPGLRRVPILFATIWLALSHLAVADDDLGTALSEASATLDQAFVDHDIATIEAMTTDDHLAVTVFYGGPMSIEDQFDVLDGLIVTEVARTQPTAVALGPDVAMVTYRNSYQGSYDGSPLSEDVFTTEIWLRQDGTWRQRLFQETPLMVD